MQESMLDKLLQDCRRSAMLAHALMHQRMWLSEPQAEGGP